MLLPRDYMSGYLPVGATTPVSLPRLRSAPGHKACGPNSNAHSSIPIRPAGDILPTHLAGFCPGQTVLWRRGDLECAGGIEMLANEVAEDAAATKIVRGAGRKVRLVDRPSQPLGYRSASDVWYRQLRWARLGRAGFLRLFLPEALSGCALPMLALALAAPMLGLPPMLPVIFFAVVWYGAETLLALAAGWHVSMRYPLVCLARDLLLLCCLSAGFSATASSGAATTCRSSDFARAPARVEQTGAGGTTAIALAA